MKINNHHRSEANFARLDRRYTCHSAAYIKAIKCAAVRETRRNGRASIFNILNTK